MFLIGINFFPQGGEHPLGSTFFIKVVNNPLEQFEINDFVYLLAPIFGFTKLSLTNIGFYLILVVFIVLTMNLLASNHYSLIPSRWSVSQESMYGSVLNLVREQIGPANEIYVPLIFALFTLILGGNLVGIIPYSFTITSHFCLNIGLSTAILLAITIIGFQRHGVGFLAFFLPAGTPLGLVPLLVVIEIISYLARAISLGCRLAANIIAGHILLKIIANFTWQMLTGGLLMSIIAILPFFFFFAISVLEMAIAFIQAYIFTILTCSYIKDSISLHGS
jgi:F-type H+-transporting ATPase subunit a